jgi:hypothetical protein
MDTRPNIVLIPQRMGRRLRLERLQSRDYRVTAPQFSLTSLADDVLATS